MRIKNFLESKPQQLIRKLFSKSARLMVISEQEGAEIFVDGIATGAVTPALIDVPMGAEIELELRLVAHEPYHTKVAATTTLSYHYCELTRSPWTLFREEGENTSFLPVHVAGSQRAQFLH